MKKLLSILLVVCLLVTSVFSASANAEAYDLTTKTLTMPELAGKYKTQGRTVFSGDILLAHYPATGIEFNAYCSGDVSVTFNVTKLYSTDQAVLDELGGCYFTVIIDGARQARDICNITSTGDVTIKIAEDLEIGEHNFEIYRQNEITRANLGFKSITLSGEFLDAPAKKDTYIEFVGASQWGGWGNLADSTAETPEASIYQDATQALAYLTAQNLDTDWSVVSVAGIGAYWGGQTMNSVYDYVGYYNDKNTLYDFARQPDYVVIGLGTNDVSRAEENGKTDADIYEAFEYFIRRMRMKNPNAKIVWVHGMMTEAVDKYVEKVVEDLGGAEYGVYDVKVTQNNAGGGSHPDAAGHAVMADEISAFIKTIKDDTFKSELPKKAENPDAEGEIIIESDFSSTTNWTKRTPAQVSYMDEDNDGVNDFARLTGLSTSNVALRSTPAQVIPGNEYELSFYARIPEGSKPFYTDTYEYYPTFAIYQPTLNDEGTQVTDNHKTGQNEYSYSYSNGTTLTRREDFTSTWQISSNFAPYTRKGYTIFDSVHEYACAHVSPDEVYKDWTKVTVKFTACASADNKGTETIALYFALNKKTGVPDGTMLDIKDVKLINKSYVETDDSNGKVVFTDFDDYSDTSKWKLNQGSAASRVSYKDEDSDGVKDYVQLTTGAKKNTYITSVPTTFVPGTEYELSFYARVPEDSASYVSGDTKSYPKISIYQPTVDGETGLISTDYDGYDEATNNYAYKKVRRTDFTANWQIGDYEPYTVKNYSIFGSQHYSICSDIAPEEVYADWTKITATFTAIDDEANSAVGDQIVAFRIGIPNSIADTKLDIKDLKLIAKSSKEPGDEVENPSFTIPELVGKYKTQGRTSVINDILMVDYSASGIEFSANCEGDVSLTFNATKLKDVDEGGCYFTVIVDGVKQARDFCHITATGDTTVTIAENLTYGKHTFEIYRQTEIERATIGIKSINLSGEFLPAPQYNDMYIEIIGDSAVTAYGNLAENGVVSNSSAPMPKYQDVTQGYAYLTARELGADWSIVAQQGRGAKYGFSEENLQDIYPKLRYNKDKTTDYDFAREPDYVIAALGTNDLYTYNKAEYTDPVATLADVKAGYKEMLALLREKNPNSIIIWAGIDYEPELEILAKEVVAEAGGEQNGYYSVKLTADKLGGNSHPSAASHITMAEELSTFIKEVDEQNDFAIGDLNDDGVFNLKDLVELAQHTADWEKLNIKTLAADVDGNKTVNLDDVTHLAKCLAGWNVELGGDMMDYTSGLTGVVNKKVTNYVSKDGLKMPYTLLVPKNYNKNKEYPVVMFFHGADAEGTCNVRPIQKLQPFYDTDAKTMSEAIVLIPQCINKEDAATMGPYTKPGWWRYKDDGKGTLNVAMELLEKEVLAKYNCDSNRFYVMGLSMGGEATWKTLEKYPEKIAAAVAICGSNRGTDLAAGDSTVFEDAAKIKDIPIWMYHGTEDEDVLVSVSEQRYDNLIAAGAENVNFTILEGYPHNVWSYAAADSHMIKWLFEQNLNNR